MFGGEAGLHNVFKNKAPFGELALISTRHYCFSLAMPICSYSYHFKTLKGIWAFGNGQSSV